MKEFELQGDISSGFRWRVKGTGELAEAERKAFVPLGDSSGSEVRMRNAGKMRPPAGTAVVFDLDYDLLFASEREARRQLLAPWVMIPLACLK